MNVINTQLVDEDCHRDEVENDLVDFCGELDEENENNWDCTEQFFLEDEVDREEQPLNSQQRYAPRKQLTRNRKVHYIDSLLDEAFYETINYLNGKGNFEEYIGYLDPKNNEKTKKIFWTSEWTITEGRQGRFDTITEI